jgi:uncharacterized protein DUF1566
MPNPANSGMPNPANYTDLGNGAVLDNVTCLTWAKTAGTSGDLTANTNYCANLASTNFAGFGDWRLPTRVEMASIVDFTRSGDALNPAFGKEPSGYFRTGSAWYETAVMVNGNTGDNARRWIYNMGSGLTSNSYLPTSSASVLCVRGNGSGETIDELAVAPPNHYSIANGEVTDGYTGLVWQQVYSSSSMAWSEAAGYCSSLNLNGHTWRVPTINELATVVNEARVSPAVDTSAFPNTVSCGSTTWFWANAEYVGSSYGWGINFCDGYTGYNAGASGAWNYFTAAYVRCVR